MKVSEIIAAIRLWEEADNAYWMAKQEAKKAGYNITSATRMHVHELDIAAIVVTGKPHDDKAFDVCVKLANRIGELKEALEEFNVDLDYMLEDEVTPRSRIIDIRRVVNQVLHSDE